MLSLHRSRWSIAVTLFACSTAVAVWIVGSLSERSLTPLEFLGVAGSAAAIVAASFWARYSEQQVQNRTGEVRKPSRGPEPEQPSRSWRYPSAD